MLEFILIRYVTDDRAKYMLNMCAHFCYLIFINANLKCKHRNENERWFVCKTSNGRQINWPKTKLLSA